MHKIPRLVPQSWDQKIAILYIFIFITSILFTFFFRKGIEFTRYALIILTAYLVYKDTKIARPIIKNHGLLALIMFLLVATASLIYNNAKIGNIDEIANWIICYISGYMAFKLMNINTKYILYLLPVALFMSQVAYPFATMDKVAIGNIFSSNRLDLFFEGKPIHLGFFCGISAFTAAGISYFSDKTPIKISYLVLSIIAFGLLISTGTRTTFAGTTATFFFALCLVLRNNKNIKRLAAISTLITLPVLFFVFNTSELRIATILSPEAVNDSYLQRELIFKVGKESFLRSPILGEGFDRFSDIYNKNINILSQDTNFDKEYAYILNSSNNAHNFSLHFLAETGILGFFCMNIFWIYIIIPGVKSKNEIAMIISGIFLLSYIALQFNMSLYGRQISTLLFSLAGISGAAIQSVRRVDLVPNPHPFLSTHEAEQ